MSKTSATILEKYKEYVVNVKKTLKEVDHPKTLIEIDTMVLPDITHMLPEDVLRFYQDLRRLVILYFYRKGFSSREIAKRIGGNHVTIASIIKNQKETLPIGALYDESIEA